MRAAMRQCRAVARSVAPSRPPAPVDHRFTHVRNNAKVLFFGVNPSDARVAISPYDVYRRDLEIYGSFSLRYTFHDALALLRSGPQ